MSRLERYISGDDDDPAHSVKGSSFRLLHLLQFWSRQMSEHALFLSLGLEDPTLRKSARDIHLDWESLRKTTLQRVTIVSDLAPVISKVHELSKVLRALKTHVLNRLLEGEWLGWLWPSFVDHLRAELDYFILSVDREAGTSKRSRPNLIREDLMTWMLFLRDHATFAAKLLDPTEVALASRASEISAEIGRVAEHCQSGMDQLISLSRKSGEILDQYLKRSGMGTEKTRSIVHPVLVAHIIREGEEALHAIQLVDEGGIK